MERRPPSASGPSRQDQSETGGGSQEASEVDLDLFAFIVIGRLDDAERCQVCGDDLERPSLFLLARVWVQEDMRSTKRLMVFASRSSLMWSALPIPPTSIGSGRSRPLT